MPSSGGERPRRLALAVDAMRVGDLDRVLEIESASFAAPWRREHFLHELRGCEIAVNLVLRHDGLVVAYVCAWQVAGELKINNIAVDARWRRRGLAERLLETLFERSRADGCREVTLEVRASNQSALALYRRLGFREDGRRTGYYPTGNEDAILMSREL